MDTSFLDEDLEMIEVLDHPALFSNGRIPREAVPKGLYAYDLYESCDTGNFCYTDARISNASFFVHISTPHFP